MWPFPLPVLIFLAFNSKAFILSYFQNEINAQWFFYQTWDKYHQTEFQQRPRWTQSLITRVNEVVCHQKAGGDCKIASLLYLHTTSIERWFQLQYDGQTAFNTLLLLAIVIIRPALSCIMKVNNAGSLLQFFEGKATAVVWWWPFSNIWSLLLPLLVGFWYYCEAEAASHYWDAFWRYTIL